MYENKFNKTFSGTDTVAFIILPGCSPVCLGSLTTISWSSWRVKAPVVPIGRIHVKGMTRGSRVFAGAMVFTLINQHWLREVQELPQNKDWIGRISELKADELPLFDIMIISANEYGSWCSMYIYGIDLTDEAQTISVEDLFTENTFKFVARDVSTFKAGQVLKEVSNATPPTLVIADNNDTRGFKWEAYQKKQVKRDNKTKTRNYKNPELEQEEADDDTRLYNEYRRPLYYINGKMIVGDDVYQVQQELQKREYNVPLTGIYDQSTENAVRDFQKSNGLDDDGVVDKRTYMYLLSDDENGNGRRYITVTSKENAEIYSRPWPTSNIVDFAINEETLRMYGVYYSVNDYGETERYYQVKNGYVKYEDAFCPVDDAGMVQYSLNDDLVIRSIKNALSFIYDYDPIYDNTLNETDMYYLKQFRIANGLDPDDQISQTDYLILLNQLGKISQESDNTFSVNLTRLPGEYTIDYKNVNNFLQDTKATVKCSLDEAINYKLSTICLYENGKKSTYSYNGTASNLNTIDTTALRKEFRYNATNGLKTNKVYMTAYFYNDFTQRFYEWVVSVK